MAEKDQVTSAEPDVQRIDYAYWDAPVTGGDRLPLRVLYSLQLFHEIDFVVNEGYRKIPHGGIETAGVLLGTISSTEVKVNEFRPIECEHASGPSIHFSERDLTALGTQMEEIRTDPAIRDIQPVGWFLGHTRGSLELTEAEEKQFSRFFPEPFHLAVIVKPERFQPTRFGFLVRRPDGEMPRDASSSAIILPLPGRSFKAGEIVASLPAPHAIATAKRPSPAQNGAPAESQVERSDRDSTETNGAGKPFSEAPDVLEARKRRKARAEARSVEAASETADLASIWKVPPVEEHTSAQASSEVVAGPEDDEEVLLPPDQASLQKRDERRKLARDRIRRIEEAYPASEGQQEEAAEAQVIDPVPGKPVPSYPAAGRALTEPPVTDAIVVEPTDVVRVPKAFRPPPLPSLPMDALRPLPALGGSPELATRREQRFQEPPVHLSGLFRARSVTALAVSALLGCLVGYVAYLQLPAPIIAIDVKPVDQTILVSWPPDETRSADSATIRLNDGVPVPLSAQERKAGHVTLTAAKDFKVEIVARNWLRDSRGIVRYLRSNSGNSRVLPIEAPSIP